MNKDYTHISVVLDRSGSMSSVAQETVSGYNEFIKEQKKQPGQCTVTLVQFDSVAVETVYNGKPVKDVPGLEFCPRAWTPLYDALGKSILETGKMLDEKQEKHRPAKVIFVIITDGHENASHEYTREQIFNMIKHQSDVYKWEFVYIGANQNAMDVGAAIGIAASNSMNYTANDHGTRSVYGAVGQNVSYARTMAMSGDLAPDKMAWKKEQRDEQEKAKSQK